MNFAICFLASVLLASCLAISNTTVMASPQVEGAELHYDISLKEESPPTSNGLQLTDLIMSPVRAMMRRVRQIFGSPEMNENMSKLREKAYELFRRMYNKQYPREEIPKRLALYVQRMKLIERSLKMFKEGQEKYVLKPNKFIDWDETELKQLSRTSLPQFEAMAANDSNPGDNEIEHSLGSSRLTLKADTIPRSKDWSKTGCVSPVIDQGSCGSCYAVATLGAIESRRCILTGSGTVLSPQHIVDCVRSRKYNANGCDGGWPTSVFQYLQDTKTAVRDKCYRYVKYRKTCTISTRRSLDDSDCILNPAVRSSSTIKYKVLKTEEDILYHVANTGPVVSVVQTTNSFLMYGGGVFSDRRCRNGPNDIDHAILIVGYGTENGENYWLIKNSWGEDWGEKGYGKVKRGYTCSVGRWGWVMIE